MLTTPQINHIKGVAQDLFVQSYLTPIKTQHSSEFLISNPELVEEIMSVIGDSGLIYLSVWENLTAVWSTFRRKDDVGICQWLLQSATTFRVLGFTGVKEYQHWVEHLATAYCAHVTPSGDMGTTTPKDLEAALAIDDEYADRLPKITDYRALLYANPWFVYLATLQLSYHEIYSGIIASQFTDELKSRLTGSRGTA